jgi:hypothetical protein
MILFWLRTDSKYLDTYYNLSINPLDNYVYPSAGSEAKIWLPIQTPIKKYKICAV